MAAFDAWLAPTLAPMKPGLARGGAELGRRPEMTAANSSWSKCCPGSGASCVLGCCSAASLTPARPWLDRLKGRSSLKGEDAKGGGR